MNRLFFRHVLKARINIRDALADALEVSYKKFKHHIDTQKDDLDQDIKARCRVQRKISFNANLLFRLHTFQTISNSWYVKYDSSPRVPYSGRA